MALGAGRPALGGGGMGAESPATIAGRVLLPKDVAADTNLVLRGVRHDDGPWRSGPSMVEILRLHTHDFEGYGILDTGNGKWILNTDVDADR
jgi:hypothetical protein